MGEGQLRIPFEQRVRGKFLYATNVAHPAVYSESVLPALASFVGPEHEVILDPFGGVGKVHRLPAIVGWPMKTIAVEIEPEWANCHPGTLIADALHLPFRDETFDAVVTSPTYGNRMADSHDAEDGSIRRSYTHDLGRKLTPGNSGSLQWGDRYRMFHTEAWHEAYRVIRPAGRLVLNISDHIRAKRRQYVASWHTECLIRLGFALAAAISVATSRHREGANSAARVDSEFVLAFDKTA